LIKESDIKRIEKFISKDYRCLKIDGRHKGGVIISQRKFSLSDDDKIKIRNIA
jgi:hypothetical protein